MIFCMYICIYICRSIVWEQMHRQFLQEREKKRQCKLDAHVNHRGTVGRRHMSGSNASGLGLGQGSHHQGQGQGQDRNASKTLNASNKRNQQGSTPTHPSTASSAHQRPTSSGNTIAINQDQSLKKSSKNINYEALQVRRCDHAEYLPLINLILYSMHAHHITGYKI